MRIVYMGTPAFASEILKKLHTYEHGEIIAVYTQPDRLGGRGKNILMEPETKITAKEFQIPVYQPEKFRNNPEAVEQLKALNPDILVVAAYGMLLPQEVLDIPKYGAYNVHGSLLPKYRGAAPVQRCLLSGDTITGVTIMRMEAGLDTGPIFLQQAVNIQDSEENCHNSGTLLMDIAHSGAALLLEALEFIRNNDVTLIPQNEELATHAAKLTKQEAQTDFTKDSVHIHNHVRCFSPNPGATANLVIGEKAPSAVRIESGYPLERLGFQPTEEQKNADCGTVVGIFKNYIAVKCGNGFYGIRQIRLAGKPSMDAKSFQNGYLRGNSRVFFKLPE